MYRTIIVPIDPSQIDKGEAMIESAKQVGGGSAQIVLTAVVEDIPAYVAAEMPDGIIEQSKTETRKALQEMAEIAGPGAVVEVRAGHAPTAILAVASERNADLIIIASHKPEFRDYLLGSTAAKVVRHADCSVLVMR